jgi:hypothetical protein
VSSKPGAGHSAESIAKEVVNQLNEGQGPLQGEFQAYFFDKGKLKTTSVVSYAIKQIVKLQGDDSLFAVWKHTKKDELSDEADLDLLKEYISFCVKEINLYVSAIKAVLPKERWTADKKTPGRLLTTTNVNGWIICLRKIIEKSNVHGFDYYKSKFSDLNKFNFSKYRSSQYARMADDMFERFFS